MTAPRRPFAALALVAVSAVALFCGCSTTSHHAHRAYFLSERPDGAGVTLYAVELEGDIPGDTSGAGPFPIATGLLATESTSKGNPAPERRTVMVGLEEGKIAAFPMDASDIVVVLVNDIARLGREANLFARLAGGGMAGGVAAGGGTAPAALLDEGLFAGLKRRLQLERDLTAARKLVAADENRMKLARERIAMAEKMLDESVRALEGADAGDPATRGRRREASEASLQIEAQRGALAAMAAEAEEPVRRVEELAKALDEDGSIDALRAAMGMTEAGE